MWRHYEITVGLGKTRRKDQNENAKMIRRLLICATLALAGCEPLPSTETPPVNAGRRVVPASELADAAGIRFRHVDAVNALRQARGLQPVRYSQALNSSALTHARDMSLQQRAWHFGSDRSNPQSRAVRAGFAGRVTGENIAETFEGEFDTLQNWLNDPQTVGTMIDPRATDIGFAWFREQTGKIWWVQVFGAPGRPGS